MAAPARAGDRCPAAAPPEVEVKTAEAPVSFDVTRSRDELASLDIDTVSPWPSQYHASVGGLMRGKIAADHRIAFRSNMDGAKKKGCVQFLKIEVTLRMDPKIFVAREIARNSCLFQEVFGHEAKHIDADRALIEKYARQIRDGLRMATMETADYTSPVVPAMAMESVRKRMEEGIGRALGVMFEKMMRERAQRQQAIDNIDEYSRVSGSC
ncbi:MAG: hypothetical protein HY370_00800, partial [Proteobacteria bacterium]|nr:hypothetical protein [Pseudomonadota bacterium]